jgi:hypothetical protein
MHLLFSKNEIERALVALALGTKNPREFLEIGFSGETIHPSWSLGRDHQISSLCFMHLHILVLYH